MEPSTLVTLFGGISLAAVLALLLVLSRKGRTEDAARAYLAGFKYVLSDDADAAIAELSRAAQLDRQTLDTYFALGALFRRKGELDRAIRVHQNILLRPGIAPDVKRRARLELALDYKRSGLRDKALETFEKLLADEPENVEALVGYRQLLEDAKDWPRAIEAQSRLVKLKEGQGRVLAHLLSEASRTHLPDRPEEAEKLAARAVEIDPSSANAQLALGEARVALGRLSEAADSLRRAVTLEPELALRALPYLEQADPALEAFLAEGVARSERPELFDLALAVHLKKADPSAAIERLKRLVERRPRFWEARKELGVLLLAQDRSEELRADYREILGTLGQPPLGFHCESCRQKLPEHLFRCPSCEEWGTVRREFDRGSARV